MGLISEIFGYVRGGGETDTLVGAETALARLAAERAGAIAAIDAAHTRRRDLLVEDGSDKQIAAIDREIGSHQLTLDRLDAIEGRLIEQLQALRSGHRREQWAKFYKRHAVAAAEFVEKYRAAVRALNALTATTDEARAAGFEHEAMAHFVPPPQMLDFALIANFESAVEDIADAVAGRRKPMPVQPERKPYSPPPAPAPSPFRRRVSLADVEDRPPAKPRRPLRADKAGPGQRLVSIARNGIEAPDGDRLVAGDVVALPEKQAEQLVRNGGGDFADGSLTFKTAEGA